MGEACISDVEMFGNGSVLTLPLTPPYSTVVLAPVVGGMVVLTILPLVFATILACCVTGYVRDVLFHKVVKGCIGPFCNIVVSRAVFELVSS